MRAGIWLLAFFLSPFVYASRSTINLTEGATRISADIYNLHMLIFLVCCVIGVIVFGFLLYALIYHRKSQGAKPADFHEHVGIEIAWAVVPFIILVVMAVPATRVLMDMRDSGASDITIKVTGYQWKWEYEYLHEGIRFFSNLATPWEQIDNTTDKGKHYLLEVDNPLVLPIHKRIRFLVTSNDVLHSWWVPDFGVKRDAVPGYIHDAWTLIDKPGIYRGQCAELCGKHHGFMPIVIKALPQIEYDQWKAKQLKKKHQLEEAAKQVMSLEALMEKGEAVYKVSCAACHMVNGEGMPPTFPALIGGKTSTGPVADHIKIVVGGSQKNAVMQAFGKQLDPVSLAAVITYERNAWGNKALLKDGKNIVQPSDIIEASK